MDVGTPSGNGGARLLRISESARVTPSLKPEVRRAAPADVKKAAGQVSAELGARFHAKRSGYPMASAFEATSQNSPTTAQAPAAIGRRHSFVGILAEIATDIWQYRELLYQLTLRDIRVRYKQTVMGFFWAIFMPALIVMAGLLVKYAIAHFSGTSVELQSVTGLTVKALPWAFFVGAIGFGTSSLVGNVNLVTKVYFPRLVLPLSTTLAQAFDSSIGAIALAAVLPFLGISFTLQLLWVPVLVLLLFVFTAGICISLSCANLFFRDVKYIVQVMLMFGIFFTPVFFEPEMFGSAGAWMLMLNPLSPFLEGLRLSIVEGHNLIAPMFAAAEPQVVTWSPWYLLYAVVSSVGIFLTSTVIFHRFEPVLAEYA